MSSLGTRSLTTNLNTRMPGGSLTRRRHGDPGMSRRVTGSMTFAASTGRVTGSNGDFTAFVTGEPVLIEGTNLNNGLFQVTGIDATNHAYLVLDPAPKDETVSTLLRVN